jgi:hypothetical protein
VTPLKVLYSAGLGRNGGTLLDRVLGQVPGFESLGEFRMLWQKGILENEDCNCGVPFRDCGHWQAVFRRAFGSLDQVDAAELLRLADQVDRTRWVPLLLSPWKTPRLRSRIQRYGETLARLYRAIGEHTGCRVIVDSSRFAGTALILDQLEGVEVYAVHLIRDSRASAFSWQRRKQRIGVRGEAKYIKSYSPALTCFWWMNRNLSVELLRGRVRAYTRIRYEDFVAAPRQMVAELARFVGERPQQLPFVDDHTVRLGACHMQSGNPVRFQHGPVPVKLDDEWRTAMSRGKQALVTTLTWPLLWRYGYLGHDSAPSESGRP